MATRQIVLLLPFFLDMASSDTLWARDSADRIQSMGCEKKRESRLMILLVYSNGSSITSTGNWSGLIGGGFEDKFDACLRLDFCIARRSIAFIVKLGGESTSSTILGVLSGVLPRRVLLSDKLESDGFLLSSLMYGISGTGGIFSFLKLRIDFKDLIDPFFDFLDAGVIGRSTMGLSCRR
ncbi:hypothetical protein E6O75_ATG05417 [Venturia nashicola]|uniref:Uncharacterized protein n=1 Tax=Venturia nashicola TaxID=86259 RepID=A0A4Z1NWY4_9PEZI|nr:hypothetical protein E6O75_ATG05417 [Venturia nashicola]